MSRTDAQIQTRTYKLLRRAVLQRDGYVCQIRGPHCTTEATCVDHVTPRADGGAIYDPANMRASCWRCNSGRNAERTNAMRAARYRNEVATYDVRM